MGVYNGSIGDVVNGDFQAGTITVGTSQQLASVNGSSNLMDREEVTIYNKSNKTIYYGPTGVTTSNGIPIEPGEVISLQYGENINVYLIAADAGNSIIIHELA